MTGRALEAVLDQLHGLAADALITELRQHMARLAENPAREEAHQAALAEWELTDGQDERPPKPTPEPPYAIPPQFLDKVLKFLAMAGVTAPKSAPRVDALARELGDLDLDAEAQRRPI